MGDDGDRHRVRYACGRDAQNIAHALVRTQTPAQIVQQWGKSESQAVTSGSEKCCSQDPSSAGCGHVSSAAPAQPSMATVALRKFSYDRRIAISRRGSEENVTGKEMARGAAEPEAPKRPTHPTGR